MREVKYLQAEQDAKNHARTLYDRKMAKIEESKFLDAETSLEAIRYVVSNYNEKNYVLRKIKTNTDGVYMVYLELEDDLLDEMGSQLENGIPNLKNEHIKLLLTTASNKKVHYKEYSSQDLQVFYQQLPFYDAAISIIDSDQYGYILDFTDAVVAHTMSKNDHSSNSYDMKYVADRFLREHGKKTTLEYKMN